METALVPASSQEITLAEARSAAREFIRQAKASNTTRGYRAEWDQFERWVLAHRVEPIPATPETVSLYLAERAGTHKASSLGRTVSAISQAHQAAGFESPTQASVVRTLLAGIRRAKGTAPSVKAPTLTEDIRRMTGAIPSNLLGTRDRALLLVGFSGAFRRSELVGLNHADVEFTRDGLVVTLRRSKCDQEGQGRSVGIPYGSDPQTCPVRALRGWLDASAIVEGAIFRYVSRHGQMSAARLSGYAVALVVKRHAASVGLDPAKYAGHSLRAGLATSAAIGGASERSIMAQTGHRSAAMVRRYIRDGSLFRENAASRTGL